MKTAETLTPSEATDIGLSKSALYRGTAAGKYTRIARGIYRPTDAPAADWEWLEAATRRADATICLTSALAYYDLADAIPDALDVAIPRGSRIPATEAAIRWRAFDKATFEIGRETMGIPGSAERIGIYSPERSILDALRLRGDIGYEIGRDALREWLRRGGKPAAIAQLAEQLPRTRAPFQMWIEALA